MNEKLCLGLKQHKLVHKCWTERCVRAVSLLGMPFARGLPKTALHLSCMHSHSASVHRD